MFTCFVVCRPVERNVATDHSIPPIALNSNSPRNAVDVGAVYGLLIGLGSSLSRVLMDTAGDRILCQCIVSPFLPRRIDMSRGLIVI